MALKIHFTAADLARVRVAAEPDPLWEVLLGVHALQVRDPGPVLSRWRTRTGRPRSGRHLAAIAPARGYSPDFLTPAESTGGLAAGLDAVRATPRTRLKSELTLLADGRPMAPWTRELASGKLLRELTSTLAAFHRETIAPHAELLAEAVQDDRRLRARALLDSGVDGLLTGLHPLLTRSGDALVLHGTHVTGDLHLDGRGVRLVPSFFCHGAPTVLADPALPPVIVYPMALDPRKYPFGHAPATDPSAALATLLGKTRAHLLTAAAGGRTTTELSRRVGVSPASASYHASILRSAGLLTSHREGTMVRHCLTDLGSGLLRNVSRT
ncbi:ArsR/SmtB family transcription factor [Amycolatopsis sp. CA-161197]|uniref:ArsR/SmtB family transcription factor n=1 Tax=Amycolatopsis sp. CA-161197 TaxID=3239922 RepID=UPI003D90EC73